MALLIAATVVALVTLILVAITHERLERLEGRVDALEARMDAQPQLECVLEYDSTTGQ